MTPSESLHYSHIIRQAKHGQAYTSIATSQSDHQLCLHSTSPSHCTLLTPHSPSLPHDLSFILPHLAQVHHSLSIKFPHPPHLHPTGVSASFRSRSAVNREILSYAEERGASAGWVGRVVEELVFGVVEREGEGEESLWEIEVGRSMPQASQVR